MADYTWYGLGGGADYLISPENTDQLRTVIQRCSENDLPFYVLGNGSNLLVRDQGIRGAVIKLQEDEFTRFDFTGSSLKAAAGAGLNKIIQDTIKRGLGGLEALTGIPGTIGGAVKMNAGGHFGDIGTAVQSVTVMDKQGQIFEKEKPELVFDYRQSNITARVILAANIELAEADKDDLLKTVKEVWIYKKNTQPLDTKNAGCVFKNPRGMSAGALIDKAGLKGTQVGGAVVSSKHANFILTEKGCKSADVLKLIEQIQQRVKEKFDVELELEIEIW